MGKTHVLRSRLVMNYTTTHFLLIVLGSANDRSSAQCVSHLLPPGGLPHSVLCDSYIQLFQASQKYSYARHKVVTTFMIRATIVNDNVNKESHTKLFRQVITLPRCVLSFFLTCHPRWGSVRACFVRQCNPFLKFHSFRHFL